jgi:hypothetical protein
VNLNFSLPFLNDSPFLFLKFISLFSDHLDLFFSEVFCSLPFYQHYTS